MIPHNCLTHAFDKLHAEGGYLKACASRWWDVCHALHESRDGRVTSYVPPGKLPTPLHAIIGFRGEVVEGHDPEHARPMSRLGIVVSAWIFALGATAWAIGRMLKR
jgi:hypothetical protein